MADNKVEFRVVHGASSLGEVDLRSLTETGRWANNLGFNEATGYRTVDAIVHNVELLAGSDQVDVFEVDLGITSIRRWCWRCQVLARLQRMGCS